MSDVQKGALETIMAELYGVRREVHDREKKPKLAIYYGRLAHMEIKRDPEIMRHLQFNVINPKIMPQTIMGAMLFEDYGLPDYAVAIHVNGKPYTTLSLDPALLRGG